MPQENKTTGKYNIAQNGVIVLKKETLISDGIVKQYKYEIVSRKNYQQEKQYKEPKLHSCPVGCTWAETISVFYRRKGCSCDQEGLWEPGVH